MALKTGIPQLWNGGVEVHVSGIVLYCIVKNSRKREMTDRWHPEPNDRTMQARRPNTSTRPLG